MYVVQYKWTMADAKCCRFPNYGGVTMVTSACSDITPIDSTCTSIESSLTVNNWKIHLPKTRSLSISHFTERKLRLIHLLIQSSVKAANEDFPKCWTDLLKYVMDFIQIYGSLSCPTVLLCNSNCHHVFIEVQVEIFGTDIFLLLKCFFMF